jgi:uncharacterized protein (TIGR02996 family)
MARHEGFLEAIRAEPESLALRLIYADWLDDHDDPRGAFIRTQCQLEALAPGDPARVALEVESDALLDAYRPEWIKTLPAGRGSIGFRRGFIESIGVHEAVFATDAGQYRSAEPLREVGLHFYSYFHEPRQPFDATLLEGLAGVRWFGDYTRDDLRRLTESPPESLSALGLLAHEPDRSEPELLARSPLALRLKKLALTPPQGPDNATLGLFRSRTLRQLEELSLHNVTRGEEVAPLLAEAASLPSLRALALINCALPTGEAGWFHGQPGWEKLTALRVEGVGPGHEAFAELAKAGALAGLHTLEVKRAWMSPDQAGPFARSACVRGLAVLSLAGCRLQDETLLRLVRSKHLGGLRSLDLSDNWGLTSRAVEGLANAPALAGLVRLNLRGVRMGDEGAVALAGSPHLSELRELDLQGCCIGSRGVQAIARSRNFSQLRRLNLSKNRIDRDGARALAGSPWLYRLISLALHGNTVDDVGAIALARSSHLWGLRHLGLKDNWVREGGLCKMLELLRARRLHRLDVAGNHIGRLGASRLKAWADGR